MNTPVPLDADRVPCRANPDRMFPTVNGNGRPSAVEAAKTVCNTGASGKPCPLKAPCLDYALTHAVEGIWGGTDEQERAAIRAKTGTVPEKLTFGSGARGWGLEPHGTPARYRRHLRDGDPVCGACSEATDRTRVRVKCSECGVELFSSSLPRHRRLKHEAAA